jgi:hypothetical protein
MFLPGNGKPLTPQEIGLPVTKLITLTTAFTASITSVPTDNTYTAGPPTSIYLGYGAQSTVLQVGSLPASGAPYTYSWNGGSATNRLSSTTSSAPVFTPIVWGNYTFGVTITNKNGCSYITYISICVTDVRVPGTNGDKIYVCHAPPGNPANTHILSIGENSVESHIGPHPGDRLGSCDQSVCNAPVVNTVVTVTQNTTKEKTDAVRPATEGLKLVVTPNPSINYFTLKFSSKDEAPISLRVTDARGRVIESRSKISANSTLADRA